MILRFEGVAYRYPAVEEWSLKEIDLAVPEGQSVLLAGSSGSGKSTLCRACTGLIPRFHGGQFSGRVVVDGLDTKEHPVYRLFSHAGLVFQNPDAQLFNHTVETELAYGLESLGLAPPEIEKRLAWASDLVGLGPLLARQPHALSGGEKQRVAVGAILALRPRLLLLDEPFTHLDPERAEILRTLLETIRSEGISIMVAEHRLHEVTTHVDRLVVLHEGRIASDGPPRQVLGSDISKYGLNVPPLIRFFHESGWQGTPLTMDEALDWLKVRNLSASRALSQGPLHKEERVLPSSPGDPNPAVRIEGLSFNYSGFQALRNINLTLAKGECVALVGRNGAGKTTLIKHLNGLLTPDRGRVEVLGRPIGKASVRELARHVGFAWQNPNDQLFQANVRDEVLTGPRALRAYDPAWCSRLLERFELTPLLGRSPFRLSEGQKKRVSFASALAVRPEIVVLDEPTAGQDEPFRQELGRLIRELRADGRTVVLVTHDLEFAQEHGDRWIALADGEIVADGASDSVMADSVAMERAGLRPTQRFQLFQKIRKLREERSIVSQVS